ncbi:ParB/RepB/Spo0J family partition protein [Agathobaculum sp.]|uniref:ParB/RepB/Spo0J family partition protein n=1 Tax=Agathobaculum sp. TaxID=2048138 RepID=UPI00352032F8
MGFSITDMLNKDTSMAAAPVKDHTIERISYSKLVPSEDNFYSMQEIEELKTAIELAGRVLNNLVVTPLEDGKYKILSGHRRHRAVGMLLDEGKTEYEFLPCSVEQIDDTDRAVREQVLLIAANSQREKTTWDKLEEVRRMRYLQRQAKAEQGLNGRVRDLVARSLNISSSRVAKYDSILNNLISPLMEEIKADNLPISTAYELSKLNTEQQQAAFTCFVQTGKLPTGDVFQSNTPDTTVQPEVSAPQSESASETPQTDNVFQSNTLPGDAARLVQQLTCLPDSKLPRLAKLLGTSTAQLTADLNALNNLC